MPDPVPRDNPHEIPDSEMAKTQALFEHHGGHQTAGEIPQPRGQMGPPADSFRFDSSVALEPLGQWTMPSDEKSRQLVADDRVRYKFMNEQAFTPEQKAAKAAGYKACQFNQFVSDQLSLHRRGRDTRDHQCLSQKYEGPSCRALCLC